MRIEPFVWQRLGLVPEAWRGRVERGYRRRVDKPVKSGVSCVIDRIDARALADAWLMDTTAIFERVRVPLGVSDGDIRERAERCAKEAMSLAEIVPGVFVAGVADMRARLARFVASYGAIAPGPKVKDGPAVRRMTCPHWWRRALRMAQARQLEFGAVALGYVHKAAEIYASDATVLRRQEQRRRNAAMLEQTDALNLDTGDEYTLAELAAVSVANPAIRRGELMTRISGFEAVAKGLGHIAEFVTLTTPSRFHRMRKTNAGKVVRNVRYDGSTPRDAQKYLVGVWARIRAKLARMGLRVYGFRIAEPHHDATPHWHLLLFMAPELPKGAAGPVRFRPVFREYALRDSGDEPGADQYRVKFEAIDWNRGTAAGYVLKYVAKNIDGNGYEVQGDFEAGCASIVPTQRVEAWASTWGIRQFQQVGGPPVGVWRELRRMREAADGPEVLESARSAADVGNWGRYVEVMGGPVVERRALPLRAAYTEAGERIDTRTGEVTSGRVNAYGEPSAPVVYGVRYQVQEQRVLGIASWVETVQRVAASTRYRWEITRGSNARTGEGFFVRGGARGAGVSVVGGAGRTGASGGGLSDADNGGAVRAGGSAVGGVCGSGGEFQEERGIRQVQVSGAAGGVGGSGGVDVGFSGGFLSGAAQPRRARTRVNNCTGGSDDNRREGTKSGGIGAGGVEFAATRDHAQGQNGGSGHGGSGRGAGARGRDYQATDAGHEDRVRRPDRG